VRLDGAAHQELDSKQRLSAARSAADQCGTPFRQATEGDLVEAPDAGRRLGEISSGFENGPFLTRCKRRCPQSLIVELMLIWHKEVKKETGIDGLNAISFSGNTQYQVDSIKIRHPKRLNVCCITSMSFYHFETSWFFGLSVAGTGFVTLHVEDPSVRRPSTSVGSRRRCGPSDSGSRGFFVASAPRAAVESVDRPGRGRDRRLSSAGTMLIRSFPSGSSENYAMSSWIS
jgi:hypothetical protein